MAMQRQMFAIEPDGMDGVCRFRAGTWTHVLIPDPPAGTQPARNAGPINALATTADGFWMLLSQRLGFRSYRDPTPADIRPLLLQLSAGNYAARAAAENLLASKGPQVQGPIVAALAEATDAETHERLQSVLDRISPTYETYRHGMVVGAGRLLTCDAMITLPDHSILFAGAPLPSELPANASTAGTGRGADIGPRDPITAAVRIRPDGTSTVLPPSHDLRFLSREVGYLGTYSRSVLTKDEKCVWVHPFGSKDLNAIALDSGRVKDRIVDLPGAMPVAVGNDGTIYATSAEGMLRINPTAKDDRVHLTPIVESDIFNGQFFALRDGTIWFDNNVGSYSYFDGTAVHTVAAAATDHDARPTQQIILGSAGFILSSKKPAILVTGNSVFEDADLESLIAGHLKEVRAAFQKTPSQDVSLADRIVVTPAIATDSDGNVWLYRAPPLEVNAHPTFEVFSAGTWHQIADQLPKNPQTSGSLEAMLEIGARARIFLEMEPDNVGQFPEAFLARWTSGKLELKPVPSPETGFMFANLRINAKGHASYVEAQPHGQGGLVELDDSGLLKKTAMHLLPVHVDPFDHLWCLPVVTGRGTPRTVRVLADGTAQSTSLPVSGCGMASLLFPRPGEILLAGTTGWMSYISDHPADPQTFTPGRSITLDGLDGQETRLMVAGGYIAAINDSHRNQPQLLIYKMPE